MQSAGTMQKYLGGPWRRGFLVFSFLLALCLIIGMPFHAWAAGAPTATLPAVANGKVLAIVRAGGATLHEAPGDNPIQDLATGTPLTATGRTADGTWVSVRSAEGFEGWVLTEQLVIFGLDYLPVLSNVIAATGTSDAGPADEGSLEEQASPTSDALSYTATVSTTLSLNIRAGPGMDYLVIGKAAPASTVTVVRRSEDGQWLQVEQPELPAGFGWVSARYLDLGADVSDLPLSGEISDAPGLPAPRTGTQGDSGLAGTLVFQERSGGTIYAYDLASGDLRPITTGADPAISPDGQTIAFWRGGNEHTLHLIDIDGQNERRILTRGEMIRAPTWSPDGQLIAFSRVTGDEPCRDVGYNICLPDSFPYNLMFPLKLSDRWGLSRVDLQGGQFQDLPTNNSAISPDWSDAGVVYQGVGIQMTSDALDNAESWTVLGEPRYQDPDLQPGGGRIVFHSLEKDHREIFAVNSDGTNLVALTRPPSALYEFPQNVAPVWSPDGRLIVFLSNRSGQWALWVMDSDGSNLRQLPIDVPIEYNYQAEQVVSWGI